MRLLGGVGVSDAAGDSVFVTVENHWGGAQCLGVWRVGRGAPGSQGSCVCWASGGFLPCLRGNGLVRLGAAGPSAPGRKLELDPFSGHQHPSFLIVGKPSEGLGRGPPILSPEAGGHAAASASLPVF